MTRSPDPRRPMIVHMVNRFAVGGMENGLVNLMNRLPVDFADHCVIALTEVSPAFRSRVSRQDVQFFALNKPAGQTARILPRLYRLLRRLRPDVVHTRNIATLECQAAAWAARVPIRIHGEHGWDTNDLGGTNTRLLRVRRLMRHFVHRQIALSAPTARYLVESVGVASTQVASIYNGVDTTRFFPARTPTEARAALAGDGLRIDDFLIGTVGRLAPVKNQRLMIDAFALAARDPAFRAGARLILVGDGPDRGSLETQAAGLGLGDRCRFVGERDDVPQWLRALDLFCLPSLAEGISNAILEAMASGVPVLATDVGGNRELIDPSHCGALVASGDAQAMATSMRQYFIDSDLRSRHARGAREHVLARFSMEAMIANYQGVYESEFRRTGLLSDGHHSSIPLQPNA